MSYTGKRTKYAGIFKRTTSRGDRYDVFFREDTGKQRTRTFPTLREARDFKQDTEGALRRGEYVDDTDKVTVAQYARRYLVARASEQRESTRRHQQSIVNRHIDGTTLGGMPLARVRREHVDAWLAEMLAKWKRSTVRDRAGFLRSVFTYAVENRRITHAPIVRLPKSATGRRSERDIHPVGIEDARQLAAATTTLVERTMVLVQQGCGLRRGELLGLRHCDVSVEFRTVRVDGQMALGGQRVDYGKTDDSLRTVPMSLPVAEALAEYLAACPPPADPEAALFVNPRTGQAWRLQTFDRAFATWVAAAGLHPNTTSHDLRHGFAITLRRTGLGSAEVGRLMGHADGGMVERTYSEFMPDDDMLARDAIDRAWAAGAESPAPSLRAAR